MFSGRGLLYNRQAASLPCTEGNKGTILRAIGTSTGISAIPPAGRKAAPVATRPVRAPHFGGTTGAVFIGLGLLWTRKMEVALLGFACTVAARQKQALVLIKQYDALDSDDKKLAYLESLRTGRTYRVNEILRGMVVWKAGLLDQPIERTLPLILEGLLDLKSEVAAQSRGALIHLSQSGKLQPELQKAVTEAVEKYPLSEKKLKKSPVTPEYRQLVNTLIERVKAGEFT